MRLPALFLAAAVLSAAGCTFNPQTGTLSATPTTSSIGMMPSGGAAGRLGPGYCQTPPSDLKERFRWNDLCFGWE